MKWYEPIEGPYEKSRLGEYSIGDLRYWTLVSLH